MEPPLEQQSDSHITSTSRVPEFQSIAVADHPQYASYESTEKRYERLRAAVFSKNPTIRRILMNDGQKSVASYVRESFSSGSEHVPSERKEEFLYVAGNEISARLGSAVAQKAVDTLRKSYVVSTADHHGPICHPWFLHPHLAAALSLQDKQSDHGSIIALACTNVSLSTSSFPSGLLLNQCFDHDCKRRKISMLPSDRHSEMVFGTRPYSEEDFSRVMKNLHRAVLDQQLTEQDARFAGNVLRTIYDTSQLFQSVSYVDQITKSNFSLWKQLLGPIGRNIDFISIGQERVAMQLLVRHHMSSRSSIHYFLFDQRSHEFIDSHFDGIQGAFSKEQHKGTYLFWGCAKNGTRRIQLWRNGSTLESTDGTIRIPLEPNAIRSALLNGDIIPSLLVVFITIALHYGVRCLGGFSQIEYLTQMRSIYAKFLQFINDPEGEEVCSLTESERLHCDFHLATIRAKDGSVTSATGLDMLRDATRFIDALDDTSNTLTLEEAIAPEMPAYYQALSSSGEELSLSLLRASDIQQWLSGSGRYRTVDAVSLPSILL